MHGSLMALDLHKEPHIILKYSVKQDSWLPSHPSQISFSKNKERNVLTCVIGEQRDREHDIQHRSSGIMPTPSPSLSTVFFLCQLHSLLKHCRHLSHSSGEQPS